jgi:hypothetical protein
VKQKNWHKFWSIFWDGFARFCLVFLIIGTILFFSSYNQLNKEYNEAYNYTVSASGKILSYNNVSTRHFGMQRVGGRYVTHSCKIEYEYTVDGQKYQGSENLSGYCSSQSFNQPDADKKVNIHYNPNKISDSAYALVNEYRFKYDLIEDIVLGVFITILLTVLLIFVTRVAIKNGLKSSKPKVKNGKRKKSVKTKLFDFVFFFIYVPLEYLKAYIIVAPVASIKNGIKAAKEEIKEKDSNIIIRLIKAIIQGCVGFVYLTAELLIFITLIVGSFATASGIVELQNLVKTINMFLLIYILLVAILAIIGSLLGLGNVIKVNLGKNSRKQYLKRKEELDKKDVF